ncbi:CMGC protein kinase [Nemania sp. FL0031]|nr:CMGC protein kinase [Nemania sp. FL0031]
MSSSATPFEEERDVGFEKFYPMTLGEVIKEKYKVVAKLGFGSASTIWCCRNLATNTYVALKIYAHDLVAKDEIDNETTIYKHLSTAGNPDHPGKKYVRTIQDSFVVTSRAGNPHLCLVHEVLSNDILSLRYALPDRKMPEAMLKQILIHLLLALDFLHDECHIIHTDIKEDNILMGLFDPSIVEQLDTEEITVSSLYISINGYNLYRSVNFGIPKRFGRPILCDFSLARNGQVEHCHDIQPDPYRAPEVILEMPWGYAVDIWNVGVMAWDMFENRHMFDGLDPETGKYGNRFHLASIVGLLGLPPLEFLQRSEHSSVYFDDRVSWEDSQRNLEVSNKKGFLDFIRKMVRWMPESRASPSELLEDPWLLGDVEE